MVRVGAFSTMGSLEGAWSIATGNLLTLSEQQLADCDAGDSACNSGLMDNGFAMCTETGDSYTATKGICKTSRHL